MRLLSKLLAKVVDKTVILVGALYVLFPLSPILKRYVGRDSGVFLYIGWRILNGELPYKDVWDHKPPVVFYIDALGLAITKHSRWGVWLLEFAGLFFAAFVGYRLIRRFFGAFPAILSTFLWLSTLIFLIQAEWGNLTEEYALPLQFLALWLATDTFESPVPKYRYWFAIGLIGGIAFFTKQTTIGIWISIVLFLVVYKLKMRQFRELVFILFFFFSGVTVVFVSWIAFFALQGGLPQFWDCVFEYNFAYSALHPGVVSHIKPVIAGIKPLVQSGLLPLAGIGYVFVVVLLAFKRDFIRKWLPLFAIILFDLPFELLLVSISGNTYGHYYISMLPILALLSGIAFWIIFSSQFLQDIPSVAHDILAIGIVSVLLWSAFYSQYKILSFRYEQIPIISYVQSNTTSTDTVLLWGAESSVNYFSYRKSPSRFVYQYPLYTKGYTSEHLIVEFLDDLIANKPRLLIDTRNPRTPLYNFPIQTPLVKQKVAYLRCHYRMVEEIQSWIVYEYTSTSNCSP